MKDTFCNVCKTFPPDPLHKDILGPGNDCLDKMEYHWGDAMNSFYKKHALKKSGQGIGGKFNGVDIKFIMKDLHLQELQENLKLKEI